MGHSIFGWSLPPGVTMNDIDPPEQPCEVCGHEAGDCICPECPRCGEFGNPRCYDAHGLERTAEQIESRVALDRQLAADAKAEDEYWASRPDDSDVPL